ncbi:MAG: PEP-CTERM sorting domain-containing protein [Syntrophobacteraceae bacterium]|nr:PEP-CTERM sorting domain-containing protein [Syntrophobacteraceae bacterium]
MKKQLLIAFIIWILGLGFGITHSVATPLLLTYGDSNFVGIINPDNPANPANEGAAITELIGLPLNGVGTSGGNTVTRSGITFTPALPTVFTIPTNASYTTTTVTGLTGSGYVAAKYDGPNAGSLVWYVSDLSQGIQVELNWNPSDPTNLNPNKYQLSGINVFSASSVPEPSTLLLFGAGLLGLGLFGLRKKQNG